MKKNIEHRVDVDPGYCLFDDNPSKNYGIKACQIRFSVFGDRGVVYFKSSLGWYNSEARKHLNNFDGDKTYSPKDCFIGYHSTNQTDNNDEHHCKDCNILGGECYSDESGLYADEWIDGIIDGGTDWLWPKLEEYYSHIFLGAQKPDITQTVMSNSSS